MKEIIPAKVDIEPREGWKNTWYGYKQMSKVNSEIKSSRDRDSRKFSSKGESFLEQQFFLNIMSTLHGNIRFIELGAGRGDWCLATAGVCDFGLIPNDIESYKCVAVEAEPTHYKWTKEHFEQQGINGIVVNAAVWDKDEEVLFYSKENPADTYGQSVHSKGNIIVQGMTIDSLLKRVLMEDTVDFMHIDVQGAELRIWDGAKKALENGTIKNMMIGMHQPVEMNDQISKLLGSYGYKTIFSAQHHNGLTLSPFGEVDLSVDGLMVLKLENK